MSEAGAGYAGVRDRKMGDMTENDLITHLAEYVLVCYPDGDASETMVVERIIDALRALPRSDVEAALWPAVLTSNDPEPPVGTVVRDANGALWRRFDGGARSWTRADGEDDDVESWTRVAGNYGPVQDIGEADG